MAPVMYLFHNPPGGDRRWVVPFSENEDLADFARAAFEFRGEKVVIDRAISGYLNPRGPQSILSRGFDRRCALSRSRRFRIVFLVSRLALGILFAQWLRVCD